MTTSTAASASPALDALEGTFHTLLLQVGSILHGMPQPPEPSDNQPQPSVNQYLARSSAHMKQFLPKALLQFQDSIDDLETELVRAQQAIRRDLLLSRIKPDAPTDAAPAMKQSASAQHHDQPMPDAPPVKSETAAAAATAATAGASADNDTKPAAAPSSTSDDGLDAMFNDLTNPDPAPSADAPSADAKSSTAPLTQPAADSAAAAAADDDADVSSLLPGLESYANANGMPDFPSGDFNEDHLDTQNGGDDAFGGDFNFDDLINSDFGTGAEDGNNATDYNQFDDDFFNI